MTEKQLLYFSLAIPPEQYLHVYQGHAKNITVVAEDGRRVQFPAQKVQHFLTREGLYGRFEMQLTANDQFISIRRISP